MNAQKPNRKERRAALNATVADEVERIKIEWPDYARGARDERVREAACFRLRTPWAMRSRPE